MKKLITGALIIISAPTYSQTQLHDTLEVITISSVVEQASAQTTCPSSCMSLEEIVDGSQGMSLVNRGAYAAEITFRGLSSFQNSVLIDGMRVFGACTDKMDPVSSYVDKKNLSVLHTSSHSTGVHQLDLQLNRADYNVMDAFSGSAHVLYGSNNSLIQSGFDMSLSGSNAWFKLNANHTDAGNYSDGNGQEVEFTQYSKYNVLASGGKNFKGHEFTGVLIIDQAFDIGYAGLPMDVSSAKALITKLEHQRQIGGTLFRHQLYYNSIEHVMDDTNRDDVVMHMDMPGWSSTLGLSGEIRKTGNHSLAELNYEAYSNTRRAEMTMYPEGQAPMYMETWPETNRSVAQITPSWKYYFNDSFSAKFSTTLSLARDMMIEEFGMQQWEVFGKDVSEAKVTSTKSLASVITYHADNTEHQLELKLGDRIPEMSERYGFYLYNNQDGFDYIGDPDLLNEKFAHAAYRYRLEQGKWHYQVGMHGYLFDNYIFGVRRDDLITMTPGGNGVKEYANIGHAHILGGDLKIDLTEVKIPTSLGVEYRWGGSNSMGYLPQMLPWTFTSSSSYQWKPIRIGMTNRLALSYDRASTEFGESPAESYLTSDLFASTSHGFKGVIFDLEARCTNLFDTAYTTHLNWRGIMQPGRNFNVSLTANF